MTQPQQQQQPQYNNNQHNNNTTTTNTMTQPQEQPQHHSNNKHPKCHFNMNTALASKKVEVDIFWNKHINPIKQRNNLLRCLVGSISNDNKTSRDIVKKQWKRCPFDCIMIIHRACRCRGKISKAT